MNRDADYIGVTYGLITVQDTWRVPRVTKGEKEKSRTTLMARGGCVCGKEWTGRAQSLVAGNTKSCGCLKSALTIARLKTHGLKGSRCYAAWVNMMSRCYTHSNKHFKDYGARGIQVQQSWHDPSVFVADMGEPGEGQSLERIDNDKPYEHGNCAWATTAEQCRNRRSNVWVEYEGRRQILSDWARELKVSSTTLSNRIKKFGLGTAMTMTPRSRPLPYTREVSQR